MTIDYRSLHAVILPALERCLVAIAHDHECATEDLSFGVYRALETYGLECIRAVEQLAAEERAAKQKKSSLRPRVKSAPLHVDARKRVAAK